MERNDLELVLAIRDCRSLTAAALRLDVAPPVVTKRLAALEVQLGQRLSAHHPARQPDRRG